MSEKLLKELKEGFESTWSDFKVENDKLINEKSAANTEKVEKLGEQMDGFEQKFKDLETSMEKDSQDDEVNEQKDAVLHYMTKGKDQMPEEAKAKLIAGDATAGGYLINPEWDNTIVKKVTEIDPIRQFSRVTTINSSSLPYPKRETLLKGSWSSEQGNVQDDNSTYGLGEIAVHELDVNVPISIKLLMDSFANIEQEATTDVVESFAETEGAAFVNGDDVSKPQGILNGGSEEILTTGSGAIDSDDLYDLIFSIKTAYASNSNFYGNRQVLKEFRKLKDLDGQYILQTAQNGRITFDLLNYSFVETPSMEKTIAANKKILFFGDLFRGYRIVDRMGMSVLRDPFTAKKQKMVEFLFSKRVGGQVVLKEAIKILTVKA